MASSIVGSLIYEQTYTKIYINFAVGMLGIYQSNSGINYWKVAKKILNNLRGTKNYMFMYRKTNHFEVTGY